MKFKIRDIGEDGKKVRRELDSGYLRGLLAGAGVGPSTDHLGGKVDLELTRVDQTILVRGLISGEFFVTCARCLEPARIEVEQRELTLTYMPTSQPEADEVELDLEDLNTYTHDGKQIDLEPLICETLLLAIPITPLCRPECKGICTSCGADLNRDGCGCNNEDQPESPWARALGDLKKNMAGS